MKYRKKVHQTRAYRRKINNRAKTTRKANIYKVHSRGGYRF